MQKPATVDEYLAQVPEPARSTLGKVRAVIRAAAPASATEAISYGMPAFKYHGGLIGYAAFAHHCSLFPMDPTVIELFAADLKPYVTAKGTIRFASDRPLPAPLIRKIVKARVAANESKMGEKKAKGKAAH